MFSIIPFLVLDPFKFTVFFYIQYFLYLCYSQNGYREQLPFPLKNQWPQPEFIIGEFQRRRGKFHAVKARKQGSN